MDGLFEIKAGTFLICEMDRSETAIWLFADDGGDERQQIRLLVCSRVVDLVITPPGRAGGLVLLLHNAAFNARQR